MELFRPPTGLSADGLAAYTRRWADRLQASVQLRLSPTPVQSARYAARPWDLVLCDPHITGPFPVVLPPATPDTAGMQIGVDAIGDSSVWVEAASSTVCKAALYRVAKAAVFTSSGRGDWFASEAISGWTDLVGTPGAALTGVSAPTFEEVGNTGWYAYHFRHDQDDDLHSTFQFQHSWDEITAARIHVHYVPLSAAAGNVYWVFRGQMLPVGGTLTTSGSLPIYGVADAVAVADQYKHKAALLTPDLATPAIPAGYSGSSTILTGFLRRVGTSGTDTYNTNKTLAGAGAANVLLLSYDVHYYAMRYGTRGEYT